MWGRQGLRLAQKPHSWPLSKAQGAGLGGSMFSEQSWSEQGVQPLGAISRWWQKEALEG